MMTHRIKKYDNSDNSRKAYRWRTRNDMQTKNDLKRENLNQDVKHNSKIQALIQSGEVKTKIKRGGASMVNVRKH